MGRNKNFPIKECPKCGGGYGSYYVDLETGDVEGTDLHTYLNYRNTSKYATCADCGKRLFKVDEDLNVIE